MEGKHAYRYSSILMWSAIFMAILDFTIEIDAQQSVWATLIISSLFHVAGIILKKLEGIFDH